MLVVFAWKPQERGSGRRSNPLRIQPGNGQRFCLMSFCIKERLEEAKAPLESRLVVHNVSWDFVSGFGYAMTCSDIWIIDTLYIPDVQQICGRNMLETAEMVGSGHPLDCSGGKLCEAWMFGGWGWGKPNPNKVRFLPFIMPWKYGWKMACRTVFTFSRVLFFFFKNVQILLQNCFAATPRWFYLNVIHFQNDRWQVELVDILERTRLMWCLFFHSGKRFLMG